MYDNNNKFFQNKVSFNTFYVKDFCKVTETEDKSAIVLGLNIWVDKQKKNSEVLKKIKELSKLESLIQGKVLHIFIALPEKKSEYNILMSSIADLITNLKPKQLHLQFCNTIDLFYGGLSNDDEIVCFLPEDKNKKTIRSILTGNKTAEIAAKAFYKSCKERKIDFIKSFVIPVKIQNFSPATNKNYSDVIQTQFNNLQLQQTDNNDDVDIDNCNNNQNTDRRSQSPVNPSTENSNRIKFSCPIL